MLLRKIVETLKDRMSLNDLDKNDIFKPVDDLLDDADMYNYDVYNATIDFNKSNMDKPDIPDM